MNEFIQYNQELCGLVILGLYLSSIYFYENKSNGRVPVIGRVLSGLTVIGMFVTMSTLLGML